MNRKAAVIGWVSGIGFVVAVAVFFFLSIQFGQLQADEFIGKYQLELLDWYSEGEKALLFVDQSARRSMSSAAFELAEKGGLLFARCGSYAGYNIWYSPTAACYPSQGTLENNYLNVFEDKLNALLPRYTNAFIPTNNYEFYLRQDKKLLVSGGAIRPLTIGRQGYYHGQTVTLSADQIDVFFRNHKSPLEGLGQCIVQAEQSTGVPAVFIMGVAIHESGWGKSGLSGSSCPVSLGNPPNVPSYNLFGFKPGAGSGTAGSCIWATSECFTDQEASSAQDKIILCSPDLKYGCESVGKHSCRIKDSFRAYNNACDSINDFARLIGKTDRYKDSLQFANNPDEMAKFVLSKGYSTSPAWANGIIKGMNAIRAEIGLITTNQTVHNFTTTSYAILPSFTVDINYDLGDYDELVGEASKFISELNPAIGRLNSKELMMDILTKKNSTRFEYSLDCDEGAERPLNGFIELYEDCRNAADDNCLCSAKVNAVGKYTFLVKENLNDRTFEISLSEPKLNLKQTLKSNLSWVPEGFIFENNKVTIGFRDIGGTYSLDGLDSLYFYKKDNKLEIVKIENNKAIAPNNKELASNVKTCNLNKKLYRFCAKRKDVQLISYNKYTNRPELKNPVYRFAMYLEDKIAPPPVEGVGVSDTLKAERNVTISWKDSSAEDVVRYNIYFSEASFTDAAQVTKILEANDDNRETYSITYKVADDNKEYWFAVTAVDGAGNENRSVTSVSGRSVDDLSPGKATNVLFSADNKISGTMPSANEDGSAIEETSLSAEVYAIPTETGSCAVDLTTATPVIKQTSSPGSDVSIAITGIARTKPGGELINYCFAVVARDEAGNPKLTDPAINQAEIVGPVTIS